ncbi:MAG: trypsin-like serine protease [Chloroflexota bacterium]
MIDKNQILQLLDEMSEKIEVIRQALGEETAVSELGEDLAMGDAPLYEPPMTLVGEEIVGGSETEDFADCCAIGDDTGYYCTGTLIAPTIVVTARHCESATRVFFGNSIFAANKGETIRVDRHYHHPEVDLMVLVLAESATVKPRHVARGDEVYAAPSATVAGFGTVDYEGKVGYGRKRRVEVPIISIGCLQEDDNDRYGCLYGLEIVAGHRGLGLDSCKGDSGGPLYIKAQDCNDLYLLGATSRGAKGSKRMCGDGGIYVRVDLCLEWIEQMTGVVI